MNIAKKIESLDTMLRALDGHEVNGARLAQPGRCSYRDFDVTNGCTTCIVGSVMTPTTRERLDEVSMGGEEIKILAGNLEFPGDKFEGLTQDDVTGGLDIEWLSEVQAIFDCRDECDGEGPLDVIRTMVEREKARLLSIAATISAHPGA